MHDEVVVVVDLDGWRRPGAVDADNAAFKLVVGVGGRVGDVPPGAVLEGGGKGKHGDLPDFFEGCVGGKSEEGEEEGRVARGHRGRRGVRLSSR